MTFYTKTQTVKVSYFDDDGWWIGNGNQHVAAHTTLPPHATDIIYNPTSKSKIAKFDKVNKQWLPEISDARKIDYYTYDGRLIKVESPDSLEPKEVTTITPPNHDANTQRVFFDGAKWVTKETHLGKKYYDSHGIERVVTSRDFELATNQSFSKRPKDVAGFVHIIVNNAWIKKVDNIGKTAYAKDSGKHSDYLITDYNDIPDTHTLTVRPAYSEWDYGVSGWTYNQKLEEPTKKAIETNWLSTEINKRKDKLSNHLLDKQLSKVVGYVNLNQPKLTDSQVKQLSEEIKKLNDYANHQDFPFTPRPVI